MFSNREDAGEKLWSVLRNYIDKETLILAVPRGGVKVAQPICRHSGSDMDIIVPKKLRAPYNEEIAIGAVAEDNIYVVNEEAVAYLEISDSYIKDEVSHQMDQIKNIRKRYHSDKKPRIQNNTVIIIDDGIATGMTLLAAIKYLKLHNAKDIIIAAPVASKEAVYLLEAHGAKVVVCNAPDDFKYVGYYYTDFAQLEDIEVMDALIAFGPKENKINV